MKKKSEARLAEEAEIRELLNVIETKTTVLQEKLRESSIFFHLPRRDISMVRDLPKFILNHVRWLCDNVVGPAPPMKAGE